MSPLTLPVQHTKTLTYSPHLRYQVVLAGNRFFHIKETATGRVRGFRGDHNEACALARNLETRL